VLRRELVWVLETRKECARTKKESMKTMEGRILRVESLILWEDDDVVVVLHELWCYETVTFGSYFVHSPDEHHYLDGVAIKAAFT
jgi:hypothetical protein